VNLTRLIKVANASIHKIFLLMLKVKSHIGSMDEI
jgi:hypothetical protein